MTAYQDGEEEALEHIYTLYREPLYSFLYRYTRDENFSVDVVQDTFVKLQIHKLQYSAERGTVKAYLFQIAYRIMVNKLNRRKKWRSLLPFLAPHQPETFSAEDKMTIQEAVAKLPELHRAVVLLYYYHDLPQTEISTILDIPLGTVKSRLHKAIQKLKEEVEVSMDEEKSL
ncbi:RNA polymerase sigma factor [Halobacillus salinus]|uniref:RNA polymerase sigma factor n=1 Tax=Halobacillus salinus TaxID=192814 RepID=UPI0009A5DBE7|nr:RNA polymerase sigma factor [Halobacillus salinus]